MPTQLALLDAPPWRIADDDRERAIRACRVARAALHRQKEPMLPTRTRSRRPAPKAAESLARTLADTARDVRKGVDPVIIAGRLDRLSRQVDPTITVRAA